MFRTQKNKKCEEEEEEADDYEQRVVMRSRSVGVAVAERQKLALSEPDQSFPPIEDVESCSRTVAFAQRMINLP